jgi:Domain of unknown function (DUF4418)
MAGDRHWKISAGLAVAAGATLLAIPSVQPACDGLVPTAMGGAVPMRCHFSYRVELLLAVACVLVALTLFLLSDREARRLGGFFLLILGTLAAVVSQPWIIGTCGGGTCHTGGAWFETVGVFLAVVGLQATWHASARREQPSSGPDA